MLKPEITRRCTFTYLDSYQDPQEKGTFEEFDDILASLLSDSFSDEIVLGSRFRPPQLLEELARSTDRSFDERLRIPHRRILDHYVEAQVHGPVSLLNDVAFLVADPSFQDSTTGRNLEALSRKFKVSLHWHAGYVLETTKVPADFRGAKMPALAQKIAPDGFLDVKKIGDAAASLKRDPHSWNELGSEKEVLQQLKLLWHVLLRFGDSAKLATPST